MPELTDLAPGVLGRRCGYGPRTRSCSRYDLDWNPSAGSHACAFSAPRLSAAQSPPVSSVPLQVMAGRDPYADTMGSNPHSRDPSIALPINLNPVVVSCPTVAWISSRGPFSRWKRGTAAGSNADLDTLTMARKSLIHNCEPFDTRRTPTTSTTRRPRRRPLQP